MKVRKKPVEVEAILYTGDNTEVKEFMKGSANFEFRMSSVAIHTLEGVMLAVPGDYIIRGVEGEFYPCKPGIFRQTYEVIE